MPFSLITALHTTALCIVTVAIKCLYMYTFPIQQRGFLLVLATSVLLVGPYANCI